MDWQFDGVPLHPLLVHLTTVSVPVAALTAIAVAAWPAVRRWLAVGAPLIGLVALVSVPLATQSGEWLEHRERETALLERHTRLADGLLPWSIAVFVLLAAWWAWNRFVVPRRAVGAGPTRAVAVVGPVLLVAAAVGSLVEVVVIGHAGAVSVWKG